MDWLASERMSAIIRAAWPRRRAVTTISLAAHADLEGEPKRLSLALRNLAARGLIKKAGEDPFATSPSAYRLGRPPPRSHH